MSYEEISVTDQFNQLRLSGRMPCELCAKHLPTPGNKDLKQPTFLSDGRQPEDLMTWCLRYLDRVYIE